MMLILFVLVLIALLSKRLITEIAFEGFFLIMRSQMIINFRQTQPKFIFAALGVAPEEVSYHIIFSLLKFEGCEVGVVWRL